MTKQTISTEQKAQIANDLIIYIDGVAGGSANKAAAKLKGISAGYVSLIKNGLTNPEKWSPISEDTWRTLQSQVSQPKAGEWRVVKDSNYMKMEHTVSDAGKYAMTFGIIGAAGWGKTSTSSHLNDSVYHVKCDEFFSKRDMLMEILMAMGVVQSGYYTKALVDAIVSAVRKRPNSVIIFDEIDKVSDSVLCLFISLFNLLYKDCGLILTGTDVLEARIKKGCERGKKGYAEIYSRLGRKFIHLQKPTKADLKEIVIANGVYDELEVAAIVNEVHSDHHGDKRRLERLVMKQKRKEVLSNEK